VGAKLVDDAIEKLRKTRKGEEERIRFGARVVSCIKARNSYIR
jgi:hypothetical protein